MEYVIFRLLRLMGREIEMYENLYNCLSSQHDKILCGEVLDLLSNISDQDEILTTITDVERDIKEELCELNLLLHIDSPKPTITDVVKILDKKYPKICGYFIGMSKRIDDLVVKIEDTNSQNLSLLKNADTLWKDVMPLLNAWKEIEPWWNYGDDKTEIEEPIYEHNFN